MLCISKHALDQALQHAHTTEEHGKAFRKMARSLEGRLLTGEQAEFIEYAGQQIQQQGEIMIALLEQALQEGEPYLLEDYALLHQHQHQATRRLCLITPAPTSSGAAAPKGYQSDVAGSQVRFTVVSLRFTLLVVRCPQPEPRRQ